MSTVTWPVGCTRTVALSNSPPRAPSRIAMREGARPQASANVQSPIPRYFPRRSDSVLRLEKPFQSAVTSTLSRQRSGSPLSYSTNGGFVGIAAFRNRVFAPNFGSVDLHFSCGDIHEPLENKRGFGATSPPIGIDRQGIGEDRFYLAVNRRRSVDTGEQRSIKIARNIGAKRRQVSAHIGGRTDPKGPESPPPAQCRPRPPH